MSAGIRSYALSRRPLQSLGDGTNLESWITSPMKWTRVRDPIIINGAGPAGLMLAIGLQRANIPFEICESHRHDLPSKPRRNHMSQLSRGIVQYLKALLQAKTYQSFLRRIVLDPEAIPTDPWYHDHNIYTEALMELLREQVPVNYGFRLERSGISCLESVVTSEYHVGKTIRTFQGSLLVGADGIFSTGKSTIYPLFPFSDL